MNRSYKYRIYPNRRQVKALTRRMETHRQVYNDALRHRIIMWRSYRQTVNSMSQGLDLKLLRAEDSYMAECNAAALKRTLRRLDKTYVSFFRRVKGGQKKAGFPKFKSRKFFNSIEFTYNNGIRLKGDQLYIHRVGLVRMFLHRSILGDARIKAAIVKREGVRWFVVLQIEQPDIQLAIRREPVVGIDMGLEVFCALSTGELIPNPRWFRSSEVELGILQKRRARCKRGSKRYQKLSLEITGLHRRTKDKRHDFHNQLSSRLVREFGLISVEKLNIKGLARSHVSKSIGDAGWGQFLAMLEYKAAEHGSSFIKVNACGTSQLCSACGCVVKKSLSVREHICLHCGYTANRDVNAAIVILKRGKNLLDRQAA